MKSIVVEELTAEAFKLFGCYADLLNPSGEFFGSAPIKFYRDLLPMHMATGGLAVSVCQVSPRPFVIDTVEYHSYTPEGILSLNGDILVHVAAASQGECDTSRLRVFRVPCGTMLILKPGVWHHAPFTVDNKVRNVLILLPERTYANDCIVKTLSSEAAAGIEFSS